MPRSPSPPPPPSPPSNIPSPYDPTSTPRIPLPPLQQPHSHSQLHPQLDSPLPGRAHPRASSPPPSSSSRQMSFFDDSHHSARALSLGQQQQQQQQHDSLGGHLHPLATPAASTPSDVDTPTGTALGAVEGVQGGGSEAVGGSRRRRAEAGAGEDDEGTAGGGKEGKMAAPTSTTGANKQKRKAAADEESRKKKAAKAAQAEEEETTQKKKVKVGARASIACKTCRKRKVRCSAEWPICSFCTTKKLPCHYEGHPAEHGGSIHAGPSGIMPAPPTPAIEMELPDSSIVLEAVGVFFTHYYDTFPFLHRPTLEDEIKDGTAPKELICCLLALAARFYQPLRDLHPSSPSAAPEHYAHIAAELLSLPEPTPAQAPPSAFAADTAISMSRCQCFLILGFHELTAGRDNSGWLKIGQSIRMAQVLRLGFEDEIAYMAEDANDHNNPRARHSPLQAEARRRTWWALFALDRTVSDGNERPCGLKVPRIASLRMPGPDADFIAGRRCVGAKFTLDPPAWSVSTRNPLAPGESEPEADIYGHTLRIADIWANVASYIGSGGRNVDRRPPWQEGSTFSQLESALTDFEQRLPEVLKYSQQTMLAHCMGSPMEARQFGMLHLLNAGARHVLHRDYLPFLPPPDFKAGDGPVDGEPIFGDASEHNGWWQRSFDIAAESANTVSDVCSLLSGHGIILTHPFAGFAAVAAGTVHCHLRFWPQSGTIHSNASHYFNQDIEILNGLRRIYPIAERWYENLAGLAVLYFGVSRGVLDADPVKVRAGLLQLMRSAKDDAHNDSPKPVSGTDTVPRHPSATAASALVAALPGLNGSDPFAAAAAAGDRPRTLSQTLDALLPPIGTHGSSSASSPGLPHPPGGPTLYPDNHTSLHPPAFPPFDLPSNPLADFDLAAMHDGGLGGLGLGLSALDTGYLWGGNSWGLAGFGGLGGVFPPPLAPFPPGAGNGGHGAYGEQQLGWPPM